MFNNRHAFGVVGCKVVMTGSIFYFSFVFTFLNSLWDIFKALLMPVIMFLSGKYCSSRRVSSSFFLLKNLFQQSCRFYEWVCWFWVKVHRNFFPSLFIMMSRNKSSLSLFSIGNFIEGWYYLKYLAICLLLSSLIVKRQNSRLKIFSNFVPNS